MVKTSNELVIFVFINITVKALCQHTSIIPPSLLPSSTYNINSGISKDIFTGNWVQTVSTCTSPVFYEIYSFENN